MKGKKIIVLMLVLVLLSSFVPTLAAEEQALFPDSFIIEIDGVLVEFPVAMLADAATGNTFAEWITQAKAEGKVYLTTSQNGVTKVIDIDITEGAKNISEQIADPTKLDVADEVLVKPIYEVKGVVEGKIIVADTDGSIYTIAEAGAEPEAMTEADAKLADAKLKAQALVEADYTSASWKALATALAMVENDDAEKELKASAILVAIDSLVAAGEEPDTFTVIFNSMEGSAVASITDIEPGTKIEKPADPTKDGFTFIGWFTDDQYTTEWDFENDAVTKDITLFAKWEEAAAGPGYSWSIDPTSPAPLGYVGLVVKIDGVEDAETAALHTVTYGDVVFKWRQGEKAFTGTVKEADDGNYDTLLVVTFPPKAPEIDSITIDPTSPAPLGYVGLVVKLVGVEDADTAGLYTVTYGDVTFKWRQGEKAFTGTVKEADDGNYNVIVAIK